MHRLLEKKKVEMRESIKTAEAQLLMWWYNKKQRFWHYILTFFQTFSRVSILPSSPGSTNNTLLIPMQHKPPPCTYPCMCGMFMLNTQAISWLIWPHSKELTGTRQNNSWGSFCRREGWRHPNLGWGIFNEGCNAIKIPWSYKWIVLTRYTDQVYYKTW